ATYVWNKVSATEGHRLFLDLARNGDETEQAWAYISVGTTAVDARGNSASDEALRINADFVKRATEMGPGNALAWSARGYTEELLGRNESALADYRHALAAVSSSDTGLIQANAVPGFRKAAEARIDGMLGQFDTAATAIAEFIQTGKTGLTV